MKSLLIFVAIALAMTLSTNESYCAKYSAVQRGSIMAEGSFSLSSLGGDLYENSKGDSRMKLNFNPGLGFFVVDGFSIGGNLILSYEKLGSASQTMFGIAPTLAYYFNLKSSIYPFVGAGYSYSLINTDPGADDSEANLASVMMFGGVLFMINEYVGIHGKIQYSFDRITYKTYFGDHSTDGNILNIFFGFNIFLK